MRLLTRAEIWALALALATGCSHGPSYERFLASTAPPRPGYARILVYTPQRSDVVGYSPEVTVNGEPSGLSRAGSFFYVDREPGVYQVDVAAKRSLSAFGNQGESTPARVVLGLGRTAYVRIDVKEVSSIVSAQLRAIEPADAERTLRELYYAGAEPGPPARGRGGP